MKICILIICVANTLLIKGQSLKDSLFSGKLKNDSITLIKQRNNSDSVIFISTDTSSEVRGKTEKEWRRFCELQLPTPEPDKKKGTRSGQFRATIFFIVEPDGAITYLKVDSDPAIEYLKHEFEKVFKKAPKLIPSHKNGVYIKTIRKLGIVYTIDKNSIDVNLIEMNSLNG